MPFLVKFCLNHSCQWNICNRYQDDWLKASANCMQHWEKAPLEPYALQKPVRL